MIASPVVREYLIHRILLDFPTPGGDTAAMFKSLLGTVSAIRIATHPRSVLLLEIAALQRQLRAYQREGSRPKLRQRDRLLWIWLRRRWPRWFLPGN